jgi:hypothetical protein
VSLDRAFQSQIANRKSPMPLNLLDLWRIKLNEVRLCDIGGRVFQSQIINRKSPVKAPITNVRRENAGKGYYSDSSATICG